MVPALSLAAKRSQSDSFLIFIVVPRWDLKHTQVLRRTRIIATDPVNRIAFCVSGDSISSSSQFLASGLDVTGPQVRPRQSTEPVTPDAFAAHRELKCH
jgi:hypothetical protein